MFYLVHDVRLKSNSQSFAPSLYAYTDKKELANEFKSQREMEKFICEIKDLTSEEMKLLNMHSSYRLQHASFYTQSDEFGKTTSAEIVCTFGEEMSIVKNMDRIWTEFSKYLFDSSIFKSEYIKALYDLLFVDFYVFYKKKYMMIDDFYGPYYTSFGPSNDFIADEFHAKYEYDQLNLFLRYFSSTFRK